MIRVNYTREGKRYARFTNNTSRPVEVYEQALPGRNDDPLHDWTLKPGHRIVLVRTPFTRLRVREVTP